MEFLRDQPLLDLFLLIGLGLLVGRVRLFGVRLGGVTGVLLVGLVFGHLDLPIPVITHNLGFVLFIYCVGVQAGPQFVGAFREDGLRYATLALVSATTATALAYGTATLFDLSPGSAAGLLAGAATSTPTLVAAQDAMQASVVLPEGVSRVAAQAEMASAYAISYVFGLAGVILFLGYLPRILRSDLAAEAGKLESARQLGPAVSMSQFLRPIETPSIRAYRVELPDYVGQTYADPTGEIAGEVQKVKRGDEVFTPDAETLIELGDVFSAVGLRHAHERARTQFGPEVIDDDVLDRSMESRRILVSSPQAAGRSLAELELSHRHRCWLTELYRSGVELPRRPDLRLHMGDVLVLTGPRSNLDALAESLGTAEVSRHETDLVTFAFGIALGVAIGSLKLDLGGVSVGLGTSGGVLLAGLLFGLLRTWRPRLGRVPGGARWVLMELGLILFLSSVAVSAGSNIAATLTATGPRLLLCGAIVTLGTVVTTLLAGWLMRMNKALLLGAVTGTMQNSGAMQQVRSQAGSSLPVLGYVGTYAFANVLMALAGAILVRLA